MLKISISNTHADYVGTYLIDQGRSWRIVERTGDHVEDVALCETDASRDEVQAAMDRSVAVRGDRCSAIQWPTEAARCSPAAYAIVLPPPYARPILLQPGLIRLGYGLWPDGFIGQVVGLIVDAGTGTAEADIRAALTVTVLDPVFRDAVRGAATDHVWCEMDRIRAQNQLEETLASAGPGDIVVGGRGHGAFKL